MSTTSNLHNSEPSTGLNLNTSALEEQPPSYTETPGSHATIIGEAVKSRYPTTNHSTAEVVLTAPGIPLTPVGTEAEIFSHGQPDSTPELSSGSVQPQPRPIMPTAADIGKDYQSQLYAKCASGDHDPTRKYGTCGIITAICCFPIGLICLFTDSERRCARCSVPC